jgi:HSP20 family protein
MALVRYQSPFNLMNDMRQEINRLFEGGHFNTDSEESSFAQWSPTVDIKEESDKYVVHADIPGVDAKDIKISVDKNILCIQGERNLESRKEDKNYQRIERFAGNFCRQFALPQNIDGSRIQAKSKKGVLEVSIPKVEVAETKYIEVKSED